VEVERKGRGRGRGVDFYIYLTDSVEWKALLDALRIKWFNIARALNRKRNYKLEAKE
jgi:hypothetical protein